MSSEDVIRILEAKGLRTKEKKRLTNGTGYQILFEGGEIVNVYDTGKFNVQGRNSESVKQMLEDAPAGSSSTTHPRTVFVVYGHDSGARTQLDAMLRRWGIEPLILDQLPSEGLTLIEKLENYTQKAEYAIVLATPDDEGYSIGKPDEKQLRARQNVVLELGMMLALLGRNKVAILLKDQATMERPSDISGLIYIPFKDNVEDGKTLLYKELCAAGFAINPSSL